MWVDRQLQLVLSDAIQAEYLAVLARLGVSARQRRRFAQRLATRPTVTHVRPPRNLKISRDPFDNAFLGAAETGGARFLVTNDADLLEIPVAEMRHFRFRIVTPNDFLSRVRR
jgi:predicted nucleic acid-binding protein